MVGVKIALRTPRAPAAGRRSVTPVKDFMDCPICGGEMHQASRFGENWVDCHEGHHRRSYPREWNDAYIAAVVEAVEKFMATSRDLAAGA